MDLVKLSANLNCFFEQSIKKYANEALASELLSHLSGKEAFHQPSHIAKIKETASLLSDMEKNYFELSEMLKELNGIAETIADDFEIEPDVNNLKFEELINKISDELRLVNNKKIKEVKNVGSLLEREAKIKAEIKKVLSMELSESEFSSLEDEIDEDTSGPKLSEETVSEEAEFKPNLIEEQEGEDKTDEDYSPEEEYTSLEDEYGTGYGTAVETGVGSINKVKLIKDKMNMVEKLSKSFIKSLKETLRKNPDYLDSLKNQNEGVIEKLTTQIDNLDKEYTANIGKLTPAKLFELEQKKEAIKQQIYQINKHYTKNIISVERLAKHRAQMREWWAKQHQAKPVGYGQRQHYQQADLNSRFREKVYNVLDVLKDSMKEYLETYPTFEKAFEALYSAFSKSDSFNEMEDNIIGLEVLQLIQNKYEINTAFMKNLRSKGLFAKFNLEDPNIIDELTFKNLFRYAKDIVQKDPTLIKDYIHKVVSDWYAKIEQNRLHKQQLVSDEETGAEAQLRIDINADFAATIRSVVDYALTNAGNPNLPSFRKNTKALIKEVVEALIKGGFNKDQQLIALAKEFELADKKRKSAIKDEVKEVPVVKGAIEGIIEAKRVLAFQEAGIPQFLHSTRGRGVKKTSSYIGYLINKFAGYDNI